VSVLVMDGDSFFVEELEVFSESSDDFYGTFISTVVPDLIVTLRLLVIPSPFSFSKV
jgi:hypothetical protein